MYLSQPLILASNSPRRQQLLKDAGISFVVKSKNVLEDYPSHLKGKEVPLYLSELKAKAFLGELKDEILIAADTVVHLDGQILGKPGHRTEAIAMLVMLSGRTHEVITGVTILSKGATLSFHETTEVRFSRMDTKSIEYYVDNFKPFDKAGSYGIQEWIGLTAVENINGCFYNVMGLPVQRLFRELSLLNNKLKNI